MWGFVLVAQLKILGRHVPEKKKIGAINSQ
jgi:hypothetical protein